MQLRSNLGVSEPRFDLFLDLLLRGLPAREPGSSGTSLADPGPVGPVTGQL
jgi:hypothetical protein